MNERRMNWREGIGKAARARAKKRQALLVQLDATREAIQSVGLDWERYDAIKAEQRRIAARLATL